MKFEETDPKRWQGGFNSIVILVMHSDRLVDRANDIKDLWRDATVCLHSRV